MRLFKIILLSTVLFSSAVLAENSLTPDVIAKNIMSQIVNKLSNKQDYYRKNPKKLKKVAYELVKEITPNLDMPRMSWSIVGKVWRKASKSEKRAFIAEFKELLINTYVSSLLEYVDKKIEYLPYRHIPHKKTTMIRSFAIDKGKKLPIVYRFYKSKKYGWRVFDVTVVGVSLIRTYKSSYARTIRKIGLVGLTKILRKKNGK